MINVWEKKWEDISGSNFHKQEEYGGKWIYKNLGGIYSFKNIYCVLTFASHALKDSKNGINLYILN